MSRPEARLEATSMVRQLVLGISALLIAGQLAVRAWALYPSWFYTDDYRFLSQARESGFGWAYLREPFDNQFMPVGRAVAYLVSNSGAVNWGLAATLTLALQLVASVLCLVMLVTLFGARRLVLVPLALYLSCAITMPALMWWAASLNQLPLQIVFFGAVTVWVRYARGRRLIWLVTTFAVLAVGLLAYVKTVLVFAVLAALLIGWFASGPLRERVVAVTRRYLPALVMAVVVGGTFAVYYAIAVPSIFERTSLSLTGRLADAMLGSALPSGLVGGPWRWDTSNPPTGYADAPAWTVHAAWVLIAGVALLGWTTRDRTGRAWALMAGYATAAFLLVLTSRAPVAGEAIGYEYRYLTDVVPVVVLGSGLVLMELVGAEESSGPRVVPLLARRPSPWLLVAVAVVVCGSGLISSMRYAHIWHEDNPGEEYTRRVMAEMRGRGPVDLASQVVPTDVVPGFSVPYNTTPRLLPLLVDNARFPATSSRLAVLASDGRLAQALIQPATVAQVGPTPGCGWAVTPGSLRIPTEAATFDFDWWLRVGYLASDDDTMTVTAGSTRREVAVRRGAHSVYLRVRGVVDSMTVSGLSGGTTVCVDAAEVGLPVPGADL